MKNKKLDWFKEIQEIRTDLYNELILYAPTYKKRKKGFNDFKAAIKERIYEPLVKLEKELLKETKLH